MLNFKQIIKISRPRFWLYILGPFLIGSLISGGIYFWQQPLFWLGFFYFTLPANLFVYGLNDIGDQDTDQYNPKKEAYEYKHKAQNTSSLLTLILVSNTIFVIPLAGQSLPVAISLILFLLLSWQYSLPPLRTKTKPLWDSTTNILYIMPAILGLYLLNTNITLNWSLITAACLWAMAMHAFSAIPDISADKEAKIKTIATQLGALKTIRYCQLNYIFAAAITIKESPIIIGTLLIVYLSITEYSYRKPTDQLFNIYKWFPFINITTGILIFLAILLNQLS